MPLGQKWQESSALNGGSAQSPAEIHCRFDKMALALSNVKTPGERRSPVGETTRLYRSCSNHRERPVCLDNVGFSFHFDTGQRIGRDIFDIAGKAAVGKPALTRTEARETET